MLHIYIKHKKELYYTHCDGCKCYALRGLFHCFKIAVHSQHIQNLSANVSMHFKLISLNMK